MRFLTCINININVNINIKIQTKMGRRGRRRSTYVSFVGVMRVIDTSCESSLLEKGKIKGNTGVSLRTAGAEQLYQVKVLD